jgi:hypothetical protein
MRSMVAYILKPDGRSGYVNNGIVSYAGTKRPLRHSPLGLRDMKIAWERNIAKHGINRNFTLPVDLVRDARMIVQDTFYKQIIDEKLFLLIQKLDIEITGGTYKWIYNYLYKGELDLTTAKDGETKLSVSVMEGGASKLLKANEATVYDIPFDEDSILVKMDGILLTMKQNWITQAGLYVGDRLLGVVKTTSEGASSSAAYFDIFKQAEPGDLTTSQEYFLIATQAIAGALISGSITNTNLGGSFSLRLKSSAGQDISLGSITTEGTITF